MRKEPAIPKIFLKSLRSYYFCCTLYLLILFGRFKLSSSQNFPASFSLTGASYSSTSLNNLRNYFWCKAFWRWLMSSLFVLQSSCKFWTAQFRVLDCTIWVLDCTNLLDCTLRISPACRTSSMETWQKLWRCIMANIWRRRHIAGGSTHSFNLLDEELSKLIGVDISWG